MYQMATLFAQIVVSPQEGGRREFATLSTALLHKFESRWLGDRIHRHLCWEGAGRIIVAWSLDVFERTLQAYTELDGEWLNYVSSNQE